MAASERDAMEEAMEEAMDELVESRRTQARAAREVLERRFEVLEQAAGMTETYGEAVAREWVWTQAFEAGRAEGPAEAASAAGRRREASSDASAIGELSWVSLVALVEGLAVALPEDSRKLMADAVDADGRRDLESAAENAGLVAAKARTLRTALLEQHERRARDGGG